MSGRGRGAASGRGQGRRVAPAFLPLLLLALVPLPTRAQVIQGQVVDEEDERPIPQALVALYRADGEQAVATLSDSAGFYRLEVPGPGEYHLMAEGLGFEDFRSHLLSIQDPEGLYPLDLAVRRVPIPLRGLDVTVDRMEVLEKPIQLLIGVSPRSLRWEPILRDRIVEHMEKGHNLPDLIRWSNLGVVVRTGRDGVCFEIRGSCVPVVLNGFPLTTRLDGTSGPWAEMIPLEMVEVVVVVSRHESILYPAGAVLLYTSGWLGARSGM